jgi:hypothetical protein
LILMTLSLKIFLLPAIKAIGESAPSIIFLITDLFGCSSNFKFLNIQLFIKNLLDTHSPPPIDYHRLIWENIVMLKFFQKL